MKPSAAKLTVFLFALVFSNLQGNEAEMPNRLIDYNGFVKDAQAVGILRTQRRVSEEDFMRMTKDPETVILDARSAGKYRLLHVKGARNLSLPDMTAAELAKAIPAKATRVLIYCNNNFENEPQAFASKAVRASLNIYTFNSLYSYGYTNVYELGPLIDITKSKIEFEGTSRPESHAGMIRAERR